MSTTSTTTSASRACLNTGKREKGREFTWTDIDNYQSEHQAVVIVIDGGVYDVTRWVPHHPGGPDILLHYAAYDASFPFRAFHLPQDRSRITPYCIGTLRSDQGPRTRPSPSCPCPAHPHRHTAFAAAVCRLDDELHADADQWFKLSLPWLCMKIGWLVMQLAVYFVLVGGFGWNWVNYHGYHDLNDLNDYDYYYYYYYGADVVHAVLAGIALGMLWQQSGFLAHDALHGGLLALKGRQQRWLDLVIGYVCGNLLMGVSGTWWKDSHNLHHALTNVYRQDETGSIIDEQQDQRPIWMQSERLLPTSTAWERLLLRIQPITFVPLCVLFGRYAILWEGIRTGYHRPWEMLGLAVHYTWVLTSLYLLVPQWWLALVVYFTASAVQGILHIQLELSHFVTDMVGDAEVHGIAWPYFQLLVTRNVICPVYMDWFHGGLHYQIEHHLWPRMPRHRLRAASAKLKALCREYQVPYQEEPFFAALWTVHRGLYDVAMRVWSGRWMAENAEGNAK